MIHSGVSSPNGSTLTHVSAPDLLDDGAGIGGPAERLWVVIGLGEEVSVDGSLEVDDALEDAALTRHQMR